MLFIPDKFQITAWVCQCERMSFLEAQVANKIVYNHSRYTITLYYVYIGVSGGKLTCGGCISDDINNEYYCKGAERYIYFRCESNINQLEWNVSPLFETTVPLNALNDEDNIIRHDGVTILVDTIDVSSNESQIISYLWLNLGEMDSDLNVTCTNGVVLYWVLKPSGTYILCKVHAIPSLV